MAIEFDHSNHLINITSPQNTLSCQDLIDAIRIEEATERGIMYPRIASASGKEDLGAGVSVGLTVELIEPWQVKFWSGNYIAKIAGGNLVGGPSNDPIAYSAGVQVLLVQSASGTVVTVSTGSGLSVEEQTALARVDALTQTIDSNVSFLKDIEGGKWTIVNNQMVFFKADNMTEIARFDLFDGDGNRTMTNVLTRERV